MKNMNEIIKYDKEGNITKEWLEYVENLDREDLERFFIGAYILSDKRKERINEAIEYMQNAINSDSSTILPSGKITDIEYCIVAFEDLLNILKGDKE